MKKIFKPIFVLTIIIIFSSFTGCMNTKPKKYSYEFFDTFDTIIQVIGYSKSEKEFNEYADYTHDRFLELHKLFDIYDDYDGINNIKTINDNAGISPVKVDSVIIELIQFCMVTHNEVSDKVNIAMGPVLRIWHDYRSEGMNSPEKAKLPPKDELNIAKSLSNIDDIIVDEENSTVFLKKKGMMIDVGAVAKGYATELVSKELQEKGFQSFILSGGGNVKVVGNQLNDDNTLWGIGIQNPFQLETGQTNNLIDVIFTSNTSVVTSGDYQRFYIVDGKKYHHIIDPVTLMPETIFSSVTVMTENSSLADSLSTALFLMPYVKGHKLLDNIVGVDAYWVFPDGSIKYTENLEAMLKSNGATNIK